MNPSLFYNKYAVSSIKCCVEQGDIMKLLPLLTAGLLYAAFHRFHIMD